MDCKFLKKCLLGVFLLSLITVTGCSNQGKTEKNADAESLISSEEMVSEYSDYQLRSMAKAYYLKDRIEDGIQVRIAEPTVSENSEEGLLDGAEKIEIFVSFMDGEDIRKTYYIDKKTGMGTDENEDNIDFTEYYDESFNPDYIRFYNPEFEDVLSKMFDKEVGTIVSEDLESISYIAYSGGGVGELPDQVVNKGKMAGLISNCVFFNTQPIPEESSLEDIFWAESNGTYTGETEEYEYSCSCTQLSVPDCVWMENNFIAYLVFFNKLEGIYLNVCQIPGYLEPFEYEEGDDVWASDTMPSDLGLYHVNAETRIVSDEEEFLYVYGVIDGRTLPIWEHFSEYYPVQENSHFEIIGQDNTIFSFKEDDNVIGLDIFTGSVVSDSKIAQSNSNVEIEFNFVSEDLEYAEIKGLDKRSKNVLWTYKTDAYEPTEMDSVSLVGESGNQFYFVEDGKLKVLNRDDGTLLWECEECNFCGPVFAFDDNSNLYISGFYANSAYEYGYDGRVLNRFIFPDEFLDPGNLNFDDGFLYVSDFTWPENSTERLKYIADKQIDSAYSERELALMALSYFHNYGGGEELLHDERLSVDVQSYDESDELVNIQIFDDYDDHTATYNWYSVSRYTAEGTDLFDNPVDLKLE